MHYLIDGYNLLFKLKGKNDPLQQKRMRILLALQQAVTLLKLHVTIVFDGNALHPLQDARAYLEPLEVVYTEKGTSADDYIVAAIQESSAPSQAIVVSSDRVLAQRCKRLRAQSLGIQEFLALLSHKKTVTKKRTPSQIFPDFVDSPKELKRLLALFENRLKNPDL